MEQVKPFDIGHATTGEDKFGKPVFKIFIDTDKFKDLNPDSKSFVHLSLRYAEDGKTISAYENLSKTKGVEDQKSILNVSVKNDYLLNAFSVKDKICILASPKDPARIIENDFSKADYNVYSYQKQGNFRVIGNAFSANETIVKDKEAAKGVIQSDKRHDYVFIGNMNNTGEITLNDTHIQKYVDPSKEFTTLNLQKANNSEKYFCYLSNNSKNETFDYKFTIPTIQLLNLPYRKSEILLQAVKINPEANRLKSDVALTTKSNYENAFHDYFIMNNSSVIIKNHEIISFGHSRDNLYKSLNIDSTMDKDKNKSQGKEMPDVKISRDIKPPTIDKPSKDKPLTM